MAPTAPPPIPIEAMLDGPTALQWALQDAPRSLGRCRGLPWALRNLCILVEPVVLRGADQASRDAIVQLLCSGLLHTLARAEELGAAGPAGIDETKLHEVPEDWAMRNMGRRAGPTLASRSHVPGVVDAGALDDVPLKKEAPLGYHPGPWVDDVPLCARWLRAVVEVLGNDLRFGSGTKRGGLDLDLGIDVDPAGAEMEAARRIARREARRAGVRRQVSGVGGVTSASPLAPSTLDMLHRAMSEVLALRARWGAGSQGRGKGKGKGGREDEDADADAWAGARVDAAAVLCSSFVERSSGHRSGAEAGLGRTGGASHGGTSDEGGVLRLQT